MADYIVNNVHMLRTRSELTQEGLAQKVGTTRQTIIAIERGHYAPSVLLALKLSKALRAPVEEIFKISHHA